MSSLAAVTFREHGSWHYLRLPDHLEVAVGARVLYPTEEIPTVATIQWIGKDNGQADIPVCLGRAEIVDINSQRRSQTMKARALLIARHLIERHDLPMKVVGVDYHDEADQRLTVIYFEASERVDFRALIADLARTLDSRIDLRQIGSRDAASMIPSLGPCGRPTCCTTWRTSLRPVTCGSCGYSQKNQGMCGRTMCCMNYEDEQILR